MESARKVCIWCVPAILLGTQCQSWSAEDWAVTTSENQSIPWEKGSIGLGGFVAFFSSDLVFGIEGSGSQSINAEDRLGLDSNLTVFRAGAMYRPGKTRRNQFDFSYAGYHRDGDVTLSKEITIDGVTYPAGAEVHSVFNFDIIRANYSYAFLQNDRVRLALGLGVYVMPLRYKLEIETTSGRSVVEGADTTLPMPALSLRGEFRLIEKLYLNLGAEGMYLAISDYAGSMIDVNVGVEYQPWKHFGFGLGYNFLGMRVEGKGSSDYPGVNFVGQVDVRFSGLFLYGKYSF
jgi:hypothetical protein